MNEHDIQAEPSLPKRQSAKTTSGSLDDVDIGRNPLPAWLRIGAVTISTLNCIIGVAGTIIQYCQFIIERNRPNRIPQGGLADAAAWTACGTWDCTAYLILGFLIWSFRHSLLASSVLAVGSAVIAVLSIWFVFRISDEPGAFFFGGIFLPFLQLSAIGAMCAMVGICKLIAHLWGRRIRP
jgi:hypothetical protein